VILDTNALSAYADGVPLLCNGSLLQTSCTFQSSCWGSTDLALRLSRRRREYEAWLTRGRAFWNVLPLVDETAIHYANIRQQLKRNGTPLPANDVWIAALARQHDLPILSRDVHFDVVTGVTRLSWL
jgi:tRNA(fMet)-specific endonuclease VapC